MSKIIKIVLFSVLFVICIVAIIFFIATKSSTSIQAQNIATPQPNVATADDVSNTTVDQNAAYKRTCPDPSELVLENLYWTARNGAWKNYNQSLDKKVKGFIGAQWIGIKVGKVICLYEAQENISFPIALEQVQSEIILEPTGNNWSAYEHGRRLCKSANTADCAFYAQPPEDLSNIYKSIEYKGPTPSE